MSEEPFDFDAAFELVRDAEISKNRHEISQPLLADIEERLTRATILAGDLAYLYGFACYHLGRPFPVESYLPTLNWLRFAETHGSQREWTRLYQLYVAYEFGDSDECLAILPRLDRDSFETDSDTRWRRQSIDEIEFWALATGGESRQRMEELARGIVESFPRSVDDEEEYFPFVPWVFLRTLEELEYARFAVPESVQHQAAQVFARERASISTNGEERGFDRTETQ